MRGRGEGGARKGTGQLLPKKTLSGPDRVFLRKKNYLGQIGFCCSEKDRVFEANSKPQTQPEGVGGAGEGRGGGREGDGPVFAQQKPYRPDRVFLLPKTLSGPDRVFDANSKPQTGVVRGRGEGKGTGQFLLKKTLSGPDWGFLFKKTKSGPDRVFLL